MPRTVYLCPNCDWADKEPVQKIYRDKLEFWGQPCYHEVIELCCPNCDTELCDEDMFDPQVTPDEEEVVELDRDWRLPGEEDCK